ncbi:MAG TPA: hypothetical protein EYP59_21690 [Thiotrichaceae bacterium]|nr:hypothetical protein [Thiotrichaceae bacterium]
MENYAGFVEHTDIEIGRVLDTLREIEEFDNTLIFYIVGDNGGAPSGGELGTTNFLKNHNAYPEKTIDKNFSEIQDIGTPTSSPFYNSAWGWAGNAPFQWHKHVASHFGGTRNPLVISWPDGITDEQRQNKQGLRSQFHHVIDIVPTILEVTGIEAPIKVNGIDQKPIEGVSMAYTFDNQERRSRRLTQYFEMEGNRAIYHKGWVAAVHHTEEKGANGFNLQDEKWELYYVDRDFSQAVDLADNPRYQRQLNYLKDLLWAEMGRYNALPLDTRLIRRDASFHPGYTTGSTHFEFYPGAIQLAEIDAPNVKNRSYSITVDLDLSSFEDANDVNGVLVAHGSFLGGYALYLQNGILKYTYKWFDEQQYTIESTELDLATTRLQFEFTYGEGSTCAGAGGIGKLSINGTEVSSGNIERTIPSTFGYDLFDIGVDLGAPVVQNETYKGFAHTPFAGLKKVTFELEDISLQKPGTLELKEKPPLTCQWKD